MQRDSVWTSAIQQLHDARVAAEAKALFHKEILTTAEKKHLDAKQVFANCISTFNDLFNKECETAARVWNAAGNQPSADRDAKKMETVWTPAVQEAHNARITAEAKVMTTRQQRSDAEKVYFEAHKASVLATQAFRVVFDKECEKVAKEWNQRKRQRTDADKFQASNSHHH